MKKYLKEIIILLCQVVLFYLIPLLLRSFDVIGMVLFMFAITFILSCSITLLSETRLKYLYPIFVLLVFIPSVFLYYNSSALIHAVWYMFISLFGVLVGAVANKFVI